MDRSKKIVKISIKGIVVNIVLVVFKMIVGLLAHSVAVILDAVNNLSDALSSIITIIGTKLAGKKPDKKHPYGYGRIEYFSSIIIAVIVLIAGLSSFKESAGKIIKPETANYTIFSLIIILSTVFIKYFFGKYVKKEGEKLNSGSLIASGTDAISDSILSASTLVAAIISYSFKISIEGYIGIIISIFIIKSALEILKETVGDMIGVRADSELISKIKNQILKDKKILGVYDLIIHNYGPNNMIATAHIQVDDEVTAKEIHRITRNITMDIYRHFGIIITLGIYASNDKGEFKKIKNYIQKLIKEYENIIQMHGFYVDEDNSQISFDIIFNFDEKEPERKAEEIKIKLKEKNSKYDYNIIIDTDFSE